MNLSAGYDAGSRMQAHTNRDSLAAMNRNEQPASMATRDAFAPALLRSLLLLAA